MASRTCCGLYNLTILPLLCLIYRTKGNDIWLKMTFAVIGKDVFFPFLIVKTGGLFCKTKLTDILYLYPHLRSKGVDGWCIRGRSQRSLSSQ